MGLFGALFAGVAGLDSQSNAIGIISDNIANVNTTGYKGGSAAFESLVVPSASSSSFSPGGVISQNQQLVDQQGTIQATTTSTNVAIDGGGLFVVNSSANGTGTTLYSRSGDFTQDALGNFVNSDGYYLQGFPLDSAGVPANTNFSNLETVNLKSAASGAATATSTISLAANLDSSQATLLGSGETVNLTGTNNINIPAAQLIVGNDYGQDAVSGIQRGDSFNVVSGSSSTSDNFTYGGITIGRNIADNTSAGDGDGANTLITGTGTSIAANNITSGTGGQVTISVPDIADFVNSTTGTDATAVYISNFSGTSLGTSGITAADLDGSHAIVSVNVTAGTITVQSSAVTSTSGQVGSASNSLDLTNRTYDFAGNILDATTAAQEFLGNTGTSPFTTDALSFKITNSDGTTSTFQYIGTAPDVTEGQFNNLTTLQEAINDTSGLTATIANGRLYVGATNANNGLTFSNGDATGSDGLAGINWVQELGLPTNALTNINAYVTGNSRFNSLSSLATAVNDTTDLVATVNNPLGSSTLSINESNPQNTVVFNDGTSNTGSLLTEFDFKSKGGAGLTQVSGAAMTTNELPLTYESTNSATDMSSGAVTPQFSYDVTIYDALGDAHTVAFNFAKISNVPLSWAVELTAVPASDATTATGDGQLAAGTVTFSGNGSLDSVSTSLLSNITAHWTNGAVPSTLSLNLGSIGETNGLSQFSSAFNVTQANQNGSSVGELTGVSINSEGFVSANYSNGQSRQVFQIPLANVNNPDGLEAVSGNAYQQTEASGIPNLALAGTDGVGTFSPSSLEQSNVDLSQQLTNLIVAQQAYGANTKLLTVTSDLLQELNQIIQ